MRTASIVLTTAILAGATLVPSQAEACSCAVDGEIFESLPADGATDVATNAIPWLNFSGTPVLLDSAGGEVALAEVRQSWDVCSIDAQLVPAEELEPNSSYTIVVLAYDESFGGAGNADLSSITFTTGSGPQAEETLAPPAVNAAQIKWTGYTSTCTNDTYRSCLEGTYEGLLEITQRIDGRETEPAVRYFDGAGQVFGADALESGCLELRAVNEIGQRSEPREFCFEPDTMHAVDAEDLDFDLCEGIDVSELQSSDPSDDPTPNDDGTPGSESRSSDSGGCSTGGHSPSDGKTGLLLAGLLGAAALLRRRQTAE